MYRRWLTPCDYPLNAFPLVVLAAGGLVTQWEKSHPAERATCDQEAGWK
jgi:hypothetical protein